MSLFKNSRKWFFRLVQSILPTVIFCLILIGMLNRSWYIDINTGKVKTEIDLFSIVLRTQVSETIISQSLSDDPTVLRSSPHWKISSRIPFFVSNSPHYRYHDAIYESKNTAIMFDFYKINETNRKIFSRAMIRWWHSENYSSLSLNGPCHNLEHYIASERASNPTYQILCEKANHYIAEKYADLSGENKTCSDK